MENIFKNLEIKNYYTYLLVLAGFILILSLFFEVKTIAQNKLIVLCIVTIIYGLIEWIREKQIKNNLFQISTEFNNFWEMKCETSPAPPNSEIIKEFKEQYRPDEAILSYHSVTWFFLAAYLSLMIFAFFS